MQVPDDCCVEIKLGRCRIGVQRDEGRGEGEIEVECGGFRSRKVKRKLCKNVKFVLYFFL